MEQEIVFIKKSYSHIEKPKEPKKDKLDWLDIQRQYNKHLVCNIL